MDTTETAKHEARKVALKARAAAEGYPAWVRHGALLMMLDEIPAASRDRLYEIQEKAAQDYASSTLWPKTPTSGPGDRSPQAMEIRRQIAEIAERLWLAADAALVESVHGPRLG